MLGDITVAKDIYIACGYTDMRKSITLNPKQFRKPGSNHFIDVSTLDESAPEVYETIYYKEVPVVNGAMNETVIVTYSTKYKAYQKKIVNSR